MESLVSIIVPVYNLEDYVDNCLKSLVNQTYHNIEILCIDDGSTDSSAMKIKYVAEIDSRVNYFYKENGGESSARNFGMELATGDYIMFVDGDDYIHNQTIEILIKCVLDSDCDIACSDFAQSNRYSFDFENITDFYFDKLSLNEFFEKTSSFVYRSSCGKLYKREVALSARFPLGVSNGADTVYFIKVLSNYCNVIYIDKTLYFYYIRAGSASRSSFKISMLTMVEALSSVSEYLVDKNCEYLLSRSLLMMYKAIFSFKTLSMGTEYENIVLKKSRFFSKKWIKTFLGNNYIGTKTKAAFMVFSCCHFLYEGTRLLADPSMKDFYKNRRKQKGKSQKD